MILKNLSDSFTAMCDMIDDLHAKLVVEGEDDVITIAAHVRAAARKLERPRVIDGGKDTGTPQG